MSAVPPPPSSAATRNSIRRLFIVAVVLLVLGAVIGAVGASVATSRGEWARAGGRYVPIADMRPGATYWLYLRADAPDVLDCQLADFRLRDGTPVRIARSSPPSGADAEVDYLDPLGIAYGRHEFYGTFQGDREGPVILDCPALTEAPSVAVIESRPPRWIFVMVLLISGLLFVGGTAAGVTAARRAQRVPRGPTTPAGLPALAPQPIPADPPGGGDAADESLWARPTDPPDEPPDPPPGSPSAS